MKVGEFRRIKSNYANDVRWAVTTDDENFIDITAAAVQNLQVRMVLYLRKHNTMVLYADKADRTIKAGLIEEIAYRLNVGCGELIEACKAVGIDLEDEQRIRDSKQKKAEEGSFLREQFKEMLKSGSVFTTREMESQMEQFASTCLRQEA